jgi:hypothetical protein
MVKGRVTGITDQRVVLRIGPKKRILHCIDEKMADRLAGHIFEEVSLEVNDDTVMSIHD